MLSNKSLNVSVGFALIYRNAASVITVIKHALHIVLHVNGLCFCFAGCIFGGKAACAFWKFRCGFAMKLTHREEEGGEGPHKCQTSLDTRWILSACDSLHACVVSIF